MTLQPFADALRDAAGPVPAGLAVWNGSDPAPRFAVYRNHHRVSLVAALADTFPVVRELVGDEFFRAMAGAYVAVNPPRSPVLAHYGDGFADWLAGFAPAAAVPYLADMARLERARVRAFHAADVPPLAAEDIAMHLADPVRLPGARLSLHPSVSVLVSPFAIVSLWAAHQGHGRLQDVALGQAQAALVHRDGDEAVVRAIPAGAANFYRHLQQGQALGEAAAAALGEGLADAAFALDECLALLIRHGALSAWQPGS
ncbi:MAG: HvfC/BufC family peptide modification chaperone [Rubrivivax sp.]